MTMEEFYRGPTDPAFVREIAAFPGAESILNCLQCGICTGSCPMAEAMPETPRRVLAHVIAGDRERALSSESIWYCASCFTCTVRCPQGVSMADVMFALRSLAIPRTQNLSTAFYQRFTESVARNGRVDEVAVALVKVKHSGLRGMLREAPFGLGLYRRGRLSLRPHRIRGAHEVAALTMAVAGRRAARRKEAEGR